MELVLQRVFQEFDYINEKYKPSLYEGQIVSGSNINYVHKVKEHIPHSVKSLQPEVLTVLCNR